MIDMFMCKRKLTYETMKKGSTTHGAHTAFEANDGIRCFTTFWKCVSTWIYFNTIKVTQKNGQSERIKKWPRRCCVIISMINNIEGKFLDFFMNGFVICEATTLFSVWFNSIMFLILNILDLNYDFIKIKANIF